MEPTQLKDIATPIAETTAGAVRLVTLRLSNIQKLQAKKSQHFSRHVRSFLETEVKPPFRYRQVSPTAFALNSLCSRQEFDRFTIRIHDRLLEFLFGTEGAATTDILIFAGTEQEVAEFVTEPEDKAVERSRKYLQGVLSDLKKENTLTQAEPDSGAEPGQITRIAGKRPLLYRGILACPHNVMIAYAITPNADPAGVRPGSLPTDIDLARYMSFRGDEAINFSTRIFDKASYLLQTSSKDMQSVILLVPLSYKSLLSHKESGHFLKNASEQPEWVRNQMFISVFGAPTHPSTTVIQRFRSEFSPHFRTLDWQVTEPDFDHSLFLGSRLHSLTFDLHGHKFRRDHLITQFIDKIDDLRALKIRAGITGIDSRDELGIALKSKLTYLSGNAITAPLTNYSPAHQIELRDLPILEPTVLNSVTSSTDADDA